MNEFLDGLNRYQRYSVIDTLNMMYKKYHIEYNYYDTDTHLLYVEGMTNRGIEFSHTFAIDKSGATLI